MENMVSKHFYKGKKVFITGHSGFKGGWLTLWLKRLGAIVAGASLPPQSNPNLFDLVKVNKGIQSEFCDICQLDKISALIHKFEPEIMFHLAAQPIVLTSYKQPVLTHMTNIMGTVHVLEALCNLPSVKVAVIVTTDKVYQNNEWIYPYREEDLLGGHDPYSSSKAAAEIMVSSYRDSFLKEQGVAVATARAGNVIGGGDWSVNRLIPDAIHAWEKKLTLDIRHPKAIRPWQHVLEPLAGYLLLAERLWKDLSLAGPWNFGPNTGQNTSVKQVVELARQAYGSGNVEYCVKNDDPHEAGQLNLDTSKVRCLLDLQPKWGIEKAVQKSIEWYKLVAQGYDARQLCFEQIAEYEAKL